ncbi:MAG: glycosyltransferase family 2 protein [Chloroflexota bacterium]|nr:glycosyltransferase family 2 protein [Chloroflexota bacterium]
MDLSVVVVSYNVAPLLERCLESILAHPVPEMEVLVVDNASADGSARLVAERFPHVALIANERNVGFGAACNQAMRRASGRYFVFVNPDAEVQGDSLARLMAFLEARPRVAVAGGRLRYADGSFQHSAFRFPSLAQVFLDFFPLQFLPHYGRLLDSRWNGRYPRDWEELAYPVDFSLGAFFIARRAAVEEVGPFDEGFFMYVEEVDWCFRFKLAGWEVWHCPVALALHHSGRSTIQSAAAMVVELHRSRWRFYRKHYSPLFRAAARAITWAGMSTQAAGAWWADRRAGGTLPERRAHARACLQVLRL